MVDSRHSCPDFHRDKLQQESSIFYVINNEKSLNLRIPNPPSPLCKGGGGIWLLVQTTDTLFSVYGFWIPHFSGETLVAPASSRSQQETDCQGLRNFSAL